ncbi:MAG: MBL fold metallo-hydrolase [Gammaproteobacteria bacterium]|nr:MBL fold metallo-hydrolase [Gammaproteobacteria bacterium]
MSRPKLRRHLCFLDVGHGNAAVLIAGDNDVTLVDVGRHSTLREFLYEQQITRIGSVYLSHADHDHIGALVGLLAAREISIERVYLNSDATKQSKVWNDLLYELDQAHRVGQLHFQTSLAVGHEELFNGDVSLEVLAPSPYLTGKGPGGVDLDGRRIRTNSISAVIAIAVEGQRLALLPADLDSIGLSDLLRQDPDLRAPILVYPHHGGRPADMDPDDFARTLLQAVMPSQVFFSVGRGLYSTPNPRTITALRETLPDARIICTQLSEHCSRNLPQPPIPMDHLADAFAQGRFAGTCCGGTIVVPLARASSLLPLLTDHARFISTHVDTPLCLGHPSG